jgi:integrase
MVIGYLASAQFHTLRPATQQQYRRILGRLRAEYGERLIATLERRHVVALVDAKAETPVGARDFLRCLRLIIQYSISIGIRGSDPSADVKVRLPKSDGIRTWTEEEIARFEAAYPVGTKPRLAMELLLATAARRSDVVKLGRAHVRDGLIHMKQQKTGRPLQIPITDALAAAINAAAPSDHLVFLLNENGRPFSPGSFSKWFVKACRRIGLDAGLAPHGLRKASCRRMAEAGCSAHEIASVSGHMSLKEVQRYCDAADQARMAQRVAERVKAARGEARTRTV